MSVATKLIMVVPPQKLGAVAPTSPVVVGVPQLSDALKPVIQVANAASTAACDMQALTVAFAGQTTTGSVLSSTDTSNMQVFMQTPSVTVSERLKPPPHVPAVFIVTVWPLVGPTMLAFPVTDQA